MKLITDTRAARRSLAKGESCMQRGESREAEKYFAEALSFDGGLWQADLLLATVALNLGDQAKAAPHVDRVLAVEPGIAHPYYLKARILAQKGERKGALRWLKRALKINPGYEEAGRLLFLLSAHRNWRPRGYEPARLWELAITAGKKGDLKRLRSALLNLALLHARGPDFGLFQIYCMLSHYKEAHEILSRLISSPEARSRFSLVGISAPWDLEGDRSLPKTYYLDHSRKLKKIKVSRELEGFVGYLKCTLAPNLPSAGTLDTMSELRELIDNGAGKYDFARYITGRENLYACRYVQAAADFKKLLSLGYSNFVVHCSLGEALLCGGQVRLGLEKFKDAYSAAGGRDKNSVLAWEGEMRLFLKQYRQAAELLRCNGERYASCWLGAAYLEMGEFDNALRELEKAVAAIPKDPEARIWLGEAYRRGGRRYEAFRELESAGRLSTGCGPASGENYGAAWVFLNKALLFMDSGESAQMARNFSLASAAWPELISAAHRRLGIRSGATLRSCDLVRVIKCTLEMCGGYRRPDKYFLPLALSVMPSGKAE